MLVPLDTEPHGWLHVEEEGMTVVFKQEMVEGHNSKMKSKTTPINAAIARYELHGGGGGSNARV